VVVAFGASVWLSIPLARADEGLASSDRPVQWRALDASAREAYGANDWLHAARTWELAMRLLVEREWLLADELEAVAELSVHAALAYARADLPQAALATLEVADRRLSAGTGALSSREVARLRGRVDDAAKGLRARRRVPDPVPRAGTDQLHASRALSEDNELRAVGMVYGGSAALVFGLATGVLAGYGATLELRNTADRTRQGDHPHAHALLGVGIAGAVTFVPAGVATMALGLRRLRDGRAVSVRPSYRGVMVTGRF